MSYYHWLGADGEIAPAHRIDVTTLNDKEPRYIDAWDFGETKCALPDHAPYPPVDNKSRENCLSYFPMGFPITREA